MVRGYRSRMVFRRPSPELVKARQWEIRQRYSRKAHVGKRTRSMAAIRLSELTRWLDDAYGAGCELEPGQDAVAIARLFAHHMGGLPDASRRITSWLGDRAPWIKGADRERLISEATHCPLKWSADKLAWKLRLTDAKRTELKIRTIGAIDCNREQRAIRRKAKQAELQRALRAKRKASVNSI
jgi:hypothetical protein